MKRILNLPPWQSVGLFAAIVFGIYLVIAVTFQARGGSQSSLSGVAGIAAWAVLAVAFVAYLNAWRRRPNAAERLVTRYLTENRVVVDWLGRPVKVELPARIGRGASNDAIQMPVTARASGPLGSGEAHLTLARVSGAWEVLHAELDRNGRVVSLSADT
jgi:hypothetical protein